MNNLRFTTGCRVFLALMTFLYPASACKPALPVETFTLEQTLQSADIVVYGNYSSDFIGPPEGNAAPYSSKHVVFDVYCVLKSGGEVIPHNITLNGNYMWHSCFHTNLVLGQELILALENQSSVEQPEGFYKVYEPNVASVGGFEPTEKNLQAAVDLCALRDVTKPSGALPVQCPVSTKTDSDCGKIDIPTDPYLNDDNGVGKIEWGVMLLVSILLVAIGQCS